MRRNGHARPTLEVRASADLRSLDARRHGICQLGPSLAQLGPMHPVGASGASGAESAELGAPPSTWRGELRVATCATWRSAVGRVGLELRRGRRRADTSWGGGDTVAVSLAWSLAGGGWRMRDGRPVASCRGQLPARLRPRDAGAGAGEPGTGGRRAAAGEPDGRRGQQRADGPGDARLGRLARRCNRARGCETAAVGESPRRWCRDDDRARSGQWPAASKGERAGAPMSDACDAAVVTKRSTARLRGGAVGAVNHDRISVESTTERSLQGRGPFKGASDVEAVDGS